MFNLKKLIVVAAFALTSALGQSAFAENTDATVTTPAETTISVLHEATTPEMPIIDETLIEDGTFEILEGDIIGEALSEDNLQGLLTKIHGCHSASCLPACPRCRVPARATIGHCKANGQRFRCRRR